MKETLDNWLFHQGINSLWAAVPIDKYVEYRNNYNCEGVIRSKSLKTVQEFAAKIDKDPNYLKEIHE